MLTPETPSYSGSSSTPRAPTSSRATRSTGRTGRSTKTRGCGEPSSWTPEGTERLRSSPARTRRDELGEPRAGLMRCPRGTARNQNERDEGDHAPQEDEGRDQQERREAEQPRECGRGSDASHERDRRDVGEEESRHGSARTGGAHDREPEERTGECARGPLAPRDDLDRQATTSPENRDRTTAAAREYGRIWTPKVAVGAHAMPGPYPIALSMTTKTGCREPDGSTTKIPCRKAYASAYARAPVNQTLRNRFLRARMTWKFGKRKGIARAQPPSDAGESMRALK